MYLEEPQLPVVLGGESIFITPKGPCDLSNLPSVPAILDSVEMEWSLKGVNIRLGKRWKHKDRMSNLPGLPACLLSGR
jgi:hypothetical protein